jgi:hypothetical protein
MRSAALRAPTPSTLGIDASRHHLWLVKRPKHLDAPAHLSPSPPIPDPEPVETPDAPAGEEKRLDPTRYDDWEKKGIAVDF